MKLKNPEPPAWCNIPLSFVATSHFASCKPLSHTVIFLSLPPSLRTLLEQSGVSLAHPFFATGLNCTFLSQRQMPGTTFARYMLLLAGQGKGQSHLSWLSPGKTPREPNSSDARTSYREETGDVTMMLIKSKKRFGSLSNSLMYQASWRCLM